MASLFHSRFTAGRAPSHPSRLATACWTALVPVAELSALAGLCTLAPSALAQGAAPEVVTVTGRLPAAPAGVAGFGDIPLAKAPFQAVSLPATSLLEAGIDSLGEITRLDASLGDAYNSPGYWASMRSRGYTLDNRFNYQRDGLPFNAETAILLDNKERVELLKGTSGAQAGTSAPGGLVNFAVKRPRGEQRSLLLGWTESGSFKAAADIDQRLGDQGQLGLRVNASVEHLDPALHDAKGQRHLLAAAAALRPSRSSLLEAEFELSHQAQPSVPGFSLLGDQLPPASSINPRTNLNNQAWSQPVVFDGRTASLRWTETLGADWQLIGHGLIQGLRTDDRIAFPFGCSAENRYDRYCSDGSVDLYDFRSEGERRDSKALALRLEGRLDTAGLQHQLSTGVLFSSYRARLGRQAYNWAGVGQVDGSVQVPAAPELTDENTNRNERSTEWHLRDAIRLGPASQLWLGLRHTRLARDSVHTDGTAPTAVQQGFSTPWLAFSQQLTPSLLAYASWGQGIESDVAPNRPRYSNAGQALPTLKSRQAELGLKQDSPQLGWSLAAFDIQRPLAVDQGACDVDASCLRRIDGTAHHSGLEASADTRVDAWSLRASGMWLKARREGAALATDNGLVPTNVARQSLRLLAGYQVSAVPGLGLQASLSHEGRRWVLPDNSLGLPGWTSVGLASRYQMSWAGHELNWRVGVDNLFDQRAWKESPYQYGHVYLYPLEPRTFRASLQAVL